MEYILITGSNRGIGLELARQYLQTRNDVYIFATCRTPDDAKELQQLAAKNPNALRIIQLDVTNPESIEAAVGQVQIHSNKLDVLINNAGINPKEPSSRSLGSLQFDALMHVLNTNSISPVIVSQVFMELLKRGTTAKIINVSSQLGSLERKTSGGNYGYCTSKAALNMMTRCLAGDLQQFGITTITLHPGWVQTDMGGDNASLTPIESALGIIKLIQRLTIKDNGNFYRWDGTEHPW